LRRSCFKSAFISFKLTLTNICFPPPPEVAPLTICADGDMEPFDASDDDLESVLADGDGCGDENKAASLSMASLGDDRSLINSCWLMGTGTLGKKRWSGSGVPLLCDCLGLGCCRDC
jgi:hypothetical protein